MRTIPYVNRDISWLSFNYRVLQEAKDPTVPLMERLKFLAIYSSNLDEFFRVRVAYARNLKRLGRKTRAQLDFNPKELLKEIHIEVNRQQEEISAIFEKQIIPLLTQNKIFMLRRLDMNAEQLKFAEEFFHANLLPYVMPVLLVKKRTRVFLANANVYLAVDLTQKGDSDGQSRYAIVRVPTYQVPRFVELPSPTGEHHIILLDDIVRNSLSWIFPGYEINDAYSIKLTRDAELYIDDEFEGDLVEKIKAGIGKRMVGPPSRFVYDREMPNKMLDYLSEEFDLGRYDKLPEGRYHNNFDFFKFPDFGFDLLKNRPMSPLNHPVLSHTEDIFATIDEKDRFLHFPYQNYDPVVDFFQAAAKDPAVTHIKIVQYRVSKKSKILQALMEAVKAGKQVSVFVEIKARFDEAANLDWGDRLKKAGVRVYYSFPGVKVHSKLALIRRQEDGETKLYSYLSSGNFHEDTAKIYCDFGLFTTDKRLTKEVSQVFAFLENIQPARKEFQHLLVGRFNLRQGLYDLIDREMGIAGQGRHAEMVIKLNSLQDPEMIEKLYAASCAGVKIRLIIRGICCLVPGVRGFSENIEVISIVDRFLEHARVMLFHNDGAQDMFISSADWMTRNLSFRIETTFPIYDADIKREVIEILNLQLNDNVKARVLEAKYQNRYRKTDSDIPIRSQVETYFYYKRMLDANNEAES